MSNPAGNRTAICVKQLDPEWNDIWIRQKFAEFGTIVSLEVPIHRNGTRKGLAFIQYSKPEEAKNAIVALNDKKLEGRTIGVERMLSTFGLIQNKIYPSDSDESAEEEILDDDAAYIKYPRRDLTKATDGIRRPETPPTPPPSPPPIPPPIDALIQNEK